MRSSRLPTQAPHESFCSSMSARRTIDCERRTVAPTSFIPLQHDRCSRMPWRRWLLVVGSHAEDRLYGDALRRSAKRFGARIVQEKVFEDTGGARRTDSGVVQIQRQLPVFTQGAPPYDVLVAADESEVFASYLPYRTWDPRPVAGTGGLVSTTWDGSHDQWGAVQLQDRFMRKFSRRMTSRDMQAWTAVRMIGESASRTRSADPKAMLDFLRGPDFALAAFKGQRLTLSDWNL